MPVLEESSFAYEEFKAHFDLWVIDGLLDQLEAETSCDPDLVNAMPS